MPIDQDVERNMAVVKRFFEEGINQNRPELGDELVHDDFVDHGAVLGTPPGPGAGRKIVQTLNRERRPSIVIHDLFGAGDRIAMRWTAGGGAVEAVVIFRMRDGKIIERWAALNRREGAPAGSHDSSLLQAVSPDNGASRS